MGTTQARAQAMALIVAAGRRGVPALILGRAVAKAIPHKRQWSRERKERLGLAVGCALVRRKLAVITRDNRFALPHLTEPYWPEVRRIDPAEYRPPS